MRAVIYGTFVLFTMAACERPSAPSSTDSGPPPVRPKVEHEFKTLMFCRADQPKEQCAQPTCFREEKAAVLVGLEADGWEYVGPLNANSVNCSEVAFRRTKP